MKAKGYAWTLFFVCLCLIGLSIYLYLELDKKDLTIGKKDSNINTLKKEKDELNNKVDSLNIKNRGLENNNSKLKMEKQFLEKEIKVLKSKINEIIYKLSSKDIEVLEKKVVSINKDINNFYIKLEKKELYKTKALPVGVNFLTKREKVILANKARIYLKSLKENEILFIEGNSDNLKFLKDIDNRKNSNLAFERVINSILDSLNEEEINKLHYKINTKANDRDVKIIKYTYSIKEK